LNQLSRGSFVALIVVALSTVSCGQVRQVFDSAGSRAAPTSANAAVGQSALVSLQNGELPAEQDHPGFDFQPEGTADNGDLKYRVRIQSGGSPSLVALTKLTPLFNVDGKDGPTYVSDAFFAFNPNRNPRTIQPGDGFTLELPADTFVVRTASERDEPFGGSAHLVEYVSERGDVLRFYMSYPAPVQYELQDAASNTGIVHLSGELPYLLSTGRTDANRIAQLVYRVFDPDLFQMQQIHSIIGGLTPGVESIVEVDRSHTYLDPVREAIPLATGSGPVPEKSRNYLTRYSFAPDGRSAFAAIEDALGTRTDINQLQQGRVFRIEYGWDGTVRVSYRTGADDARGKRDPYQFREDDRWAELFKDIGVLADPPVRWGPGQPSDLDPFPTARDPRQKGDGDELSFDFLIPGRTVVFTFKPIRYESQVRAEQEFRSGLKEMQDRLKDSLEQSVRSALEPDSARGPSNNHTAVNQDDADQAGG